MSEPFNWLNIGKGILDKFQLSPVEVTALQCIEGAFHLRYGTQFIVGAVYPTVSRLPLEIGRSVGKLSLMEANFMEIPYMTVSAQITFFAEGFYVGHHLPEDVLNLLFPGDGNESA